MKLIKSRKEYECGDCKQTVNKGDLYSKKSVSLGQPWKPDEVKHGSDGSVFFEMQGIRYTVPFCEKCSLKGAL